MKLEYPKWIYPDGDVARGFIVQSAEEHAARVPAINGDTAREPEDLIELPVVDAPQDAHDRANESLAAALAPQKRKYTRKA